VRQIRYLSITAVSKIVHLRFPRPRTHLPNVPVTYVNPTPEPHALDMRSGAVEAPMPDLITEPTELPCGTLFVAMVGIIRTALTAVVTGEPHLRASPSLLWTSMHGYFVQCGPLHQARGSGTACTTPLTNLRTEFPET
jgi:hypothetical protein